jgi:organic hydroperoxide reductase OsmC/OhrA
MHRLHESLPSGMTRGTISRATWRAQRDRPCDHAHRYRAAAVARADPDRGTGTSGYRDYSRIYEIVLDGKPTIQGSADPAFRGDCSRWNPEELLVALLSACHKLWYLHLAAEAGIIVTAYTDRAEGVMEVGRDGVGRFKSMVLHPAVTVAAGSDAERA